jgi:hypothetical protein
MTSKYPARRTAQLAAAIAIAGPWAIVGGSAGAIGNVVENRDTPPAPPAATDRVEGVDTVIFVAMPEDFPVGSVMRARCAFVQRVEFDDGSSRETQRCTLSDEPVMVPENQGSTPDTAFKHRSGPCEWISDYWFARNESTVYAESYRLVVTPAGAVYATSDYPAEPLVCE